MRTKNTRGPRRGRISKRTRAPKPEPQVATPSVTPKPVPEEADSSPPPQPQPEPAPLPPPPPATFKCTYEGCNRILKSKGGFTVHMRKHEAAANVSQRKPSAPTFRCTMDGCNRRYKRKSAFDKHMAAHLKDAVSPESPAPDRAPTPGTASDRAPDGMSTRVPPSPKPTTTDTSSAAPVKEVKSTDESVPTSEQLFTNKPEEEEFISGMNQFSQALSDAFYPPFNVQGYAARLFLPPPPQPPPLPPLPPLLPAVHTYSQSLDILLAQPPIFDQIYLANIVQLIQFM